MVSNEEFTQANDRGAEIVRQWPVATRARYDRRRGRVVIMLNNGLEVMFPPRLVQGLETATGDQLSTIEISPSGLGLHFPQLDADLYLPGLFEGHLGSARWEARQLGSLGGTVKSTAKAAAARNNGLKGGRPRKPLPTKPKVSVPPVSV